MPYNLPNLPINPLLPKLREKLSEHQSVILAAEPGSGKTTIVPLALLDEPWLDNRKIIMLEPRRLAVRMAAKRLSELACDRVGGLVGYRIRFDKQVSSKTQIEVVTEGILTRMIQQDPELAEVGLLIFDEFHLRSMQADIALALSLDILTLRNDLKLIIMSATMDSRRISQLLSGAPVLTGQGRCFPIELNYLPRPPHKSITHHTVTAIQNALATQQGDILVFLPGAGEIQSVQSQIQGDFLCLPLYGNLPQEKQDLVFSPTKIRRVILATPIAETSLTIEGVSVVIDSGLMKVPRFSAASGLTSLQTICISKASAKQRAGRAGRLGPGICYRLWSKGEQHSKADFLVPEIIDADLAPLLLEVLQWGVSEPTELNWLDPPRAGQVSQAKELLCQLGVIDASSALTKLGEQIAALPLHPRLALMLLKARMLQLGPLACRLAAIVENRDPFKNTKEQMSADIEDRLEVLSLFEKNRSGLVRARGADPATCRRILQEARQYARLLKIDGTVKSFQEAGHLLAFAYPDRIAQKKDGAAQHLLASGRGVLLPPTDHLHKAKFLVAAHVDGGKKQGRIFLGAALSQDQIIADHAHLLKRNELVVWNKNRVEALATLSLGKLQLRKEPLLDIDQARVTKCLMEGIAQTGIRCLNWPKKALELQTRMQSAHLWEPEEWPDVSDVKLSSDLSWLEPFLCSISTLKQLKKLDIHTILLSLLSWHKQQELDKLLPIHFQVPSGSKIKISYEPGKPPVLAVRLQEMFGSTCTPTIFGGKIAVLVHLLSPASRPIQVTQDLMGFWQRTYGEVKKELKGRYPKHFWPDDPLTARATSRVKPRR